MNDNQTKARPRRPRITRFKSVDDFWRYHTDHPEAFSHMDFTGIAEMAKKVRERTDSPLRRRGGAGGGETPHSAPDNKREFQREKTASKNGIGRELNGNSRATRPNGVETNNGSSSLSTSEPPNLQSSEPPATGYKNPPAEHRFKPGNPGGPGGQLGPRSMRKYIRVLLFGDEVENGFAKEVTAALFRQAFKGNTHAIRLICENGNNRRKRV